MTQIGAVVNHPPPPPSPPAPNMMLACFAGYLHDLALIHPTKSSYTDIFLGKVGGAPPSTRYAAAVVSAAGSIYVFGGASSPGSVSNITALIFTSWHYGIRSEPIFYRSIPK